MVQPVSGSGFYWVFTGFCGFLNFGYFTKPKPDFFWVTGFTGSTADLDRISKHCSLSTNNKWTNGYELMDMDSPSLRLYLRSKQKAQLEYDRRQAEAANYADGHWKIRVKDPRFKICIDKLCNWKSMLPIPPAITAVQKTSLPGHNLWRDTYRHIYINEFSLYLFCLWN